jgi:hypothetical protein
VLEFLALASGVVAFMPPVGFWYLKSIAELLGAAFDAVVPFADDTLLPLSELPALVFCFSKRLSSAFVV